MQPTPQLSRRVFVAAASSSLAVAGANDRISIGLIGVGGRGTANLGELKKCKDSNIAVTAVCDVWRPNREKAAAAVAETWGRKPRETVDYQELLSWRDVDAVVICTPDFGHSLILKAAVEAGKDVYCEKPMGTEFAEAKAAYLAVKKSRQVVQIGTQRRSMGQYIAAARQMQAGVLGKVTRIDVAMNFQEPRWRRDYSDVKQADVAWKQFLLNRPERPFDARILRQWQLFRLCTNGISGLWMSHFSDIVHWYLGDPYPAAAVANGGVFLWKDGRETADVFQAVLTYPSGFLFSFEMNLTNAAATHELWFGVRGTLDTQRFVISGDGSKMPDRIASEIRIEPVPSTSHMENFLDCVRSRKTPRASIQDGFSHAVAGCMASTAFETGRRTRFDAENLAIL